MTCDQCRRQVQESLDYRVDPGTAVRSHLGICPECRAYAEWLDLALDGLTALPAISPRRLVGKEIRRRLIREGLLLPWWSPGRLAGTTVLGASATAVAFALVFRLGVLGGLLEAVSARTLGIVRPLWTMVSAFWGKLLPVGSALGQAAEPFVSRTLSLPWLQASAISLVGATATAVAVLLLSTLERRKLAHAVFV